MPRRIVIKIGTSSLTGGQSSLDRAYVDELAEEVAALVREGRRVVLVSSGAIRAGAERLGWEGRPRTVPMQQAAAAVGQGLLMGLYDAAFARRGIGVAQVLLTRQDAADRIRYVNARNTLTTLLRHGVVPIVNENDTVAVDEIRFGDNDTLAAQVAVLVHAELLVLLTDVEGLLDSDGRLISRVEAVTPSVRALAGSAGRDGSGGMATKLAAAEIASAAGIRTQIAPARPASVITGLVHGHAVGTSFPPRARRLAGRKHWIAYVRSPNGDLSLHPLARAALIGRKTSLLPAGVVEVRGEFSRGDVVSLSSRGSDEFGRGIVNCGASELDRIKGLQTSEARKILGRADFAEVIHRDDLVLLDTQGDAHGDRSLA